MLQRVVAAMVAAQVSCGLAMAQPALYWTGTFEPGMQSFANAVSTDGSTVVGRGARSSPSGVYSEAFRWTVAGGREGLGNIPGATQPSSTAVSVSSDGSIILGMVDGSLQPASWTASGGWTALSGLGAGSRANGLSANGQVAVGELAPVQTGAFRWTQAGGPVNIGGWGATATSSDGSVVVGQEGEQAFRWTSATGRVNLPFYPGGVINRVNAVSLDGVYSAGYAYLGTSQLPTRWNQNGAAENLGDIPGGAVGGTVFGLNADGSIAVGTSAGPLGDEAFYWTEDAGMRGLRGYLTSLGMSGLENVRLSQATAVSADGRVVVGFGTSPDQPGIAQGFVVIVPAPASLAVLSLVGLRALRRRRARHA